jgi:hypothetical protein
MMAALSVALWVGKLVEGMVDKLVDSMAEMLGKRWVY